MAITHVGSNIATGLGTSIAVALPGGVQVDDLLIVQGTLSRTGATFANSSYPGWTILRDETQLVDSVMFSRIVYRFADGTSDDTPPTFSTTTSGNTLATVGVYRGVDKTSPFVVENFTVEPSSVTTHTGPTLNNTVANAWGIFFGSARGVASPFVWNAANSPLNLRQAADSGGSNTNNATHLLADTGGSIATGNHTWSGTTSVATAQATMWAGVLRPAAAGSSNLDRLKIGNSIPSALRVGTEVVSKVYMGAVQVWP